MPIFTCCVILLIDTLSLSQDLLDSILLLKEIMAAWLPCQSKWLYLQRIFKEDKYQKKLPGDFQVYQAISDTYTTFIHQVSDNPNVLHVVSCKDESSDFKGIG